MAVERGWAMPWPGAELAATAEDAGATAFCTGEFANRNAYVTLGEMAAHTKSAKVGTAVAYAFTRSPFVHASAIRQINEIAKGGVFLGLGSGTFRMNQDWFSVPADRPLARMADLIGAIRAYLTAPNMKPVKYEGEFYPVNASIMAPVLGPIDVPILIGAFNQGMLKVAGRVADGIVGHGIFTDRWWEETIDPNMEAGAKASHRVDFASEITSVDDDDPARAERDARLMIAFYVTVKTYDSLTELHGWSASVDDIRNAFRRNDLDAMAAAVPQEMLDSIAIYGSTKDAVDRFNARKRLPDVRFHSMPSFMVSPRRGQLYANNIIELMKKVGNK